MAHSRSFCVKYLFLFQKCTFPSSFGWGQDRGGFMATSVDLLCLQQATQQFLLQAALVSPGSATPPPFRCVTVSVSVASCPA